MGRRGAKIVWTLAFVAAGCADDVAPEGEAKSEDTGEAVDPLLWQEPSVAGPWQAGTFEASFTSRDGLTLPVQIWYPTSPDTLAALHRYDGIVEGGALDDVFPACDRLRPVLLFSHGNSGIRYQSVFLTEHLAARGWIVVAPDHVGNTLFDYDDDRLQELVFRRPTDIMDAADYLFDVVAGADGPLYGCVDPVAGYAVSGHSFGGFTALALTAGALDREAVAASCAEPGRDGWLCPEAAGYFAEHPDQSAVDLGDRRIYASVALTPAGRDLLEPGLSRSAVPTFVMGGGRDDITTLDRQVEPLYAAVGARPKALGVLPEAGHYTYSDVCTWAPTYPDCDPPFQAPDAAHPMIAAAVAAFLETQLGVSSAQGSFPVSGTDIDFEVAP